jgi:hypothetical protein
MGVAGQLETFARWGSCAAAHRESERGAEAVAGSCSATGRLCRVGKVGKSSLGCRGGAAIFPSRLFPSSQNRPHKRACSTVFHVGLLLAALAAASRLEKLISLHPCSRSGLVLFFCLHIRPQLRLRPLLRNAPGTYPPWRLPYLFRVNRPASSFVLLIFSFRLKSLLTCFGIRGGRGCGSD